MRTLPACASEIDAAMMQDHHAAMPDAVTPQQKQSKLIVVAAF
jgi:hypothetical protein